MDVEQAGACFADGLNDVGAGASGVADIDAAAHAWVHIFHRFQYVLRGMPELIFWAVIVDGETDVVFLYEFLDARESFRRGVAGDNYRDSGSLAVFELAADVGVFVFGEIDGAGGVKVDACGGVVG